MACLTAMPQTQCYICLQPCPAGRRKRLMFGRQYGERMFRHLPLTGRLWWRCTEWRRAPYDANIIVWEEPYVR